MCSTTRPRRPRTIAPVGTPPLGEVLKRLAVATKPTAVLERYTQLLIAQPQRLTRHCSQPDAAIVN